MNYSEVLQKATLGGWQKDVARGELPAVIFNATIIETGERLAFSTTAPSACPLQDGLTTCAAFRDFSSIYEGADIPITTAVRLSSAYPFISPPARPLPAASLPDGKPIAGWQGKADRGESGFMNMHLADGGYYDNSGVAALVQWLHSGLSDLAGRNPTKLPKHILVIRINAFPASEKGYVKKHRGTFFQIWAPLLSLNTSRGAAQGCSADRDAITARAVEPRRDSSEEPATTRGHDRDGGFHFLSKRNAQEETPSTPSPVMALANGGTSRNRECLE